MEPISSPKHLSGTLQRLRDYVFPEIGEKELSEISSSMILQVCRKVEQRGTLWVASRVKQVIGQVFRYAIATDRINFDPTIALKGALQTQKSVNRATVTKPADISFLLRGIDIYPNALVRLFLKFSALVFCRPGEIRNSEWSEIDFDAAEWRIPAEKMKMKRVHIVPLAMQTISLLQKLRELTSGYKWLFPSLIGTAKPIGENTIGLAVRTIVYGRLSFTPHSFRGMASTSLNEKGFPPDVIERQLAHVERSAIRAAYNHAEYLPERRKMMQFWADYLDELVQNPTN